MAIINPLTYTIANGDPVDATPVQANFTQIVQDVNANAAPLAGNASQQFLVSSTANPAGAVPLAQAQQQFAALNGSASQQFAVANAATATQAAAFGQTIGKGAAQYADVTASRSLGSTYANTTGSPLAVVLTLLIPAGINVTLSDPTNTFYYGGASNSGTSSRSFTFLCLVPTGAQYYLYGSSGVTISKWLEY